jgi:hypothetical protein
VEGECLWWSLRCVASRLWRRRTRKWDVDFQCTVISDAANVQTAAEWRCWRWVYDGYYLLMEASARTTSSRVQASSCIGWMAGFREWRRTRSTLDEARRHQSLLCAVCLLCAMRWSSKTNNTSFETRVRHVTHILQRIITFTLFCGIKRPLPLDSWSHRLNYANVSVSVMCCLV